MIIDVQKPELEILIRARMATGEFQDVEDVLIQALKSAPADVQPSIPRPIAKKPLGQFLLESPLRDSGLKLERQRDFPTPIDL
jgi:hypothetical protein